MLPSLLKKTEAMLIGGAIGDALGVPCEFRDAQYIQKHHGYIDHYLPTKENIFFQKSGFTGEESGVISDDTILSFVAVQSLIEKNKIDIQDIMKLSFDALQNFPAGFGRSTTQALERFQSGVDISLCGTPAAQSNGVLMKQAPYAAFFIAQKTKLQEIENTLTTLTFATHKSQETLIATLVHNFFLMRLLEESSNSIEAIYELTCDYAKEKENSILGTHSISDILTDIQKSPEMKDFEVLEKYGWGENIWKCGNLETTFAICYALFKQKQDFTTLLRGINIGGDTDTYGAILGNMLGAYKGVFYNEKHIDGLQEKKSLQKDTEKFVQKILY